LRSVSECIGFVVWMQEKNPAEAGLVWEEYHEKLI